MRKYLFWIMILQALVLATGGWGTCFAWGEDSHPVHDVMRLARQGDTAAMCELGLAYYYGKGVLKDPFMAKCWIGRAHEQGSHRAKKLWDRLALWQYAGNCGRNFDTGSGGDHGNRPDRIFVEPVTGISFVRVPGKCFPVGETPVGHQKHAVDPPPSKRCVNSFWMGQFEVSQAQWQRMMPVNPSRFKGENHPVEQVSFKEVTAFIQKLNQATGGHFSLPTQEQWELACSGGEGQAFPWGDEAFRPKANCGTCDAGSFARRTAPVGSYTPTRLGIYDMGGNVKEWCRNGKTSREPDRPVKGGSFVDPVSNAACSETRRLIPGVKAYYLGFRLAAEDIPRR